MNFFKNVVQTATTYAQKAKDFANQWTKDERLKKNLMVCTYSDDSKFMIQKSVKQVYHVYPFFDSDILSFVEQNQMKKYLQVKANMEIEVKGVMHKVDYNIMIPNGFPKKAPYIRIVKPGNQYFVDKFYQSLKSPTDQNSYILNERLHQIKKWSQSNSLVNVIIESQDMMRNSFPFYQPNQQQKGQGWGNQNQGYNQKNMGNQPKPPIPFYTKNPAQMIAQGQKYSGESRKIFEKLKREHIKTVNSNQSLYVTRYSLQSQQQYLRCENMNMNNFLRQSEDMSTSNMSNLIQPKDDMSEQILDISASIRSRQDVTSWLEKKFQEEQISFDEFMKNVRKMEEEKFEEKVLLAKCISMSYGK